MIRFWERETREARISGVKGFALFTLPCLPSPDREKGSATSQGPPGSALSGTGMEQELHLSTALPLWQGGVRSCKCCRTFLLSWAALQRPERQTELREAPKYADVLYEHDFRAMSFTVAQNWAGKLSCDSALHTCEHRSTQNQKQLKKKKTQTSVFQILGRKKKKKSFPILVEGFS